MELKDGSETDYNIKQAQNRALTNTVLRLKVRMQRMKNSGKRYSGLPGRMGNSNGKANFENLKENDCLKDKNKELDVTIPK